MSDADSFIDEVTEEVRRDRLFALIRRYGWIAVVAIVAIVGGAAYSEYSKAQATAAAQDLGDAMLTALNSNDPADRAAALAEIETAGPGGTAVVNFMAAGAQAEAGETATAVADLEEIARTGDLPEIYRQIASFKALVLQADSLPTDQLRQGFEALAQPGAPLRLLAEEQLALIDVADGKTDAALDRLQDILQDAEVDGVLQQRVSQFIVALGGTPGTTSTREG